jgi:hypothetical protein
MRRGVRAQAGLLLAIAAAATAALGASSPAHASGTARFGIQDDAWLMYGPGTLQNRVGTLQALGARVVRFTLRWDRVAPARPSNATDPQDEAYRWGLYGDVLDELHARGIPALVTIWGSPGWANGGGAPARLPTTGIGAFARAAAARFPWVHLWTVWNEPNSRTFSVPVSPSLYVRRALNPAYAALHAASAANRVAGGVTSPRATPSGMSPLAFMQGMHAAHARLDAYAQNPYPVGRGETPSRGTCSSCFTMASLPQIRSWVTREFGPKQLWLTEYGYQTNPPDRLLGVSYAAQAAFLGQAALRVWQQPGTTILIQFLVRDEPSVGGWQSGLMSVAGAAKLSYRAFSLPLAERSRSGSRTVIWGQVRPGSGRRPYTLQRATSSGWRTIGGAARTGSGGAFQRTVTLPVGSRIRLVSPVAAAPSPTLTVS